MKINDLFESCSDIYCELMAPVCQSYALTQMELTILLFLANNPQDDTAALIVKKRRLTKSHVSVSVRALRERGYLACEHEGEDRRTVHLRPLEAANFTIKSSKLLLYEDIIFKTNYILH